MNNQFVNRTTKEIVTAYRLDADTTPETIAAWCSGEVKGAGDPGSTVWVEFAHGNGRANFGDWIVRDKHMHFVKYTNEEFRGLFDETFPDDGAETYGSSLLQLNVIKVPARVFDLKKGIADYIDQLHALSTEPAAYVSEDEKTLIGYAISNLVAADAIGDKVFSRMSQLM